MFLHSIARSHTVLPAPALGTQPSLTSLFLRHMEGFGEATVILSYSLYKIFWGLWSRQLKSSCASHGQTNMQTLCIPLWLNSPVTQKSQSGLDPKLRLPLGSVSNPNLSIPAMFNLFFSHCTPHNPSHSAQFSKEQ